MSVIKKGKIKQALLGILLLLNLPLYSQNFNQPYSRYGIGYIFPQSFIHHKGMGGASIAAMEENDYSLINPASYSNVRTFILRSGVSDYLYDVKTGTQNFQSQDFQLPYLNFAFPIDTVAQWGLNMALTPVSKIGYRMVKEGTTQNVKYVNRFSGEGGYTKFHIGTSAKIVKNLYLGANAGYMFGKHDINQLVVFPDTSTFFNLQSKNSVITGGFVFDAGLIYRVYLDSAHTRKFQLGLMANLPATLSTRREFEAFTSGNNLPISDSLTNNYSPEKGNMQLPMGVGAGLEFTKDNSWNTLGARDNRFKISADAYYRPWSQYKMLSNSEILQDYMNFNLGMEWRPNLKGVQGLTKTGSYLRRVNYRIGGSYAQSMYMVNGVRPQDYGVSMGASFPFGFRRTNTPVIELPSYIDVAVEGRQLGSISANNLQQRYIILSVGLHLSQSGWFKRTRIE